MTNAGADRARSLLAEAERLYDAAGLVHDGAKPGTIDSVTLLARSLHIAFTALRCLEGETGADWPTSVASAVAFNEREHLVTHDLGADLKLVERGLESWQRPELELERATVRDYERVFARAGELLVAIERHVDTIAPRATTPRRRALLAALALSCLGVGVLLGRCTAQPAPVTEARRTEPTRAAERAKAPSPENRPPRFQGFQTSFFRDAELEDHAFVETIPRLELDWGSSEPPALGQNDHFSVRFEGRVECFAETEITFYLSSNDGSRLFIDDRQVVDNWGLHVLKTVEGKVILAPGVHPLRLEFFDDTGDASVKLEWKSGDSARTVVQASAPD